jgi:hypothetical protein
MKDERKFEMKSKNLTKMMLMGISLVLMAAGVACSPASAAVAEKMIEEPMVQETVASVSEPAVVEAAPASNETAAIESAPAYSGVLTDAEVEGLLFMREEEKLAGDVYRYFYSLYGNSVFQNISSSEDMHTDSVLSLLNQYGIADPAVAEAGVFSNPDLQALYDQLIAQGSQSLQDALLVGAAIEEIDILDLEERIAQTDEADIQLVYQNLMQGSESHLRAFVRVMENQSGSAYTPQYLTQDRYDQIMAGVNGAGASGNVGKGGGRRWN